MSGADHFKACSEFTHSVHIAVSPSAGLLNLLDLLSCDISFICCSAGVGSKKGLKFCYSRIRFPYLCLLFSFEVCFFFAFLVFLHSALAFFFSLMLFLLFPLLLSLSSLPVRGYCLFPVHGLLRYQARKSI